IKFNRQFVAGNTNGNIRQGNGNPRTGQNFNAVRGEIISSDDKSITVKLNDGSSKIVFFSEKTEYVKSATAAKSDLKSGNTVMIMGSTNSDGSITAQNIQINPLGQVFRGGPTGTPAKE
ncbi:MAG: DUF5666 domain-containing protein, partial [Patescibacteria group bacterium]|nr:DUF5666 domain-containing protein [Patescibacteria group bacterium]